jgi:hypothetical protein
MKRIIKIVALAAIALFATAAVAGATITVNPDGSGFVGKGDVQSALGYNNKQMQDAIEAKGFKWTQAMKFHYTWSWSTSDSTDVHQVVYGATYTRAMAAAEARNNSNGKDGSLTGWNLTGAGDFLADATNGYTGLDDFNHDGFTNEQDLFAGPDAGNKSILDSSTYTNIVDGKALPGVTLPAGLVPPNGTPVV